MSLAVYMDVHVPAGGTEGLRRKLLDVQTAQDDAAHYGYDIDKIAAVFASPSKAAGRQAVPPARPSPSEAIPSPGSGNSSRGQ